MPKSTPWRSSVLLLLCVGGCGQSSLSNDSVLAFIDDADDAARRRSAPDICRMRGQQFVTTTEFHSVGARPVAQGSSDRREYCRSLSTFAQVRQYVLERKSIDVALAGDAQTAVVTAEYEERLPFYPPTSQPRSRDDFSSVQVLKTHDVSTVGIEDGEIVFLSTDSEVWETLVPRSAVVLPNE